LTELERLRRELTLQKERYRVLYEREQKALQEVFRLQSELMQLQRSRLWRAADVYWRGRRFAARLLGRRPQLAALSSPPLDVPPVLPSAFDVVCFPVIEWDFRFQRPQQLMSQLGAAGHRVFYLSNNFRPDGAPYHLRPLAENVYEVSLRGPRRDVYRQPASDAGIDELFYSLSALRKDAGLASTVSILQLPFWWPLARRAAERWAWPAVYDCMDHHAGFHKHYPKELVELEEAMTAESRLVVVSSRSLQEDATSRNSNVLLLPNACDFDHFASVRVTQPQPRPIIGYYGAIAAWFDAALVADLAERRPDWDIVLVGSTAQGDTARLVRLPNVKLAGEQPYNSLPHWLERMDVLLIPFQITPLTRATNPVKIYEMFAAGKPVVSVRLPELESMAPLVRFASTAQEFDREISAALAEQSENADQLAEDRRRFARSETWQNRIETLAPQVTAAFPRVSIVIVTYNNLALNQQCLDSLFNTTSWPNLEVFVVDNASTDGTAEWLQEAAPSYPRLTVILNSENRGFAAANNQGLKTATGEFLVLLNNDTVLPRGWLAALVRHLHSDPTIGLIGPVTNAVGNEAKVEVGYEDVTGMPAWAAAYAREHDGETFDIPMLAMFCVAMRRDVFERIGLLDERYDVGMFEDDDYTRRVRSEGFRIVCARDAFVHHWWRAAFGKLQDGEYKRIFETNRRRYEEKWGTAWEPHRGPVST
jgi:GT2 family glycosyltransferase/glycosyltransferase involved in cell wall biosynthesis